MRSVRFPKTPPRTRPATYAHHGDVIFDATRVMKIATPIEIDVKMMVNPVAILNAAPGFRRSVN
jgi:hypothetical protein